MRSAPGCCARSCSSRTVVRIEPPPVVPPNATSVMSRDPTTAKPVSVGSTISTASAERDRARTVSISSSPTVRWVRSTLAVTSAPCSRAATASSASITNPLFLPRTRGGSAPRDRDASAALPNQPPQDLDGLATHSPLTIKRVGGGGGAVPPRRHHPHHRREKAGACSVY